MSKLKDKSVQSTISATFHIENGKYGSSVHCSHYASLQFIYDVLIENDNITAKDLIVETYRQGKTSHAFAKSKIFEFLTTKTNDFSYIQKFKKDLETITRNRVDADYTEIEINKKLPITEQEMNDNYFKIIEEAKSLLD